MKHCTRNYLWEAGLCQWFTYASLENTTILETEVCLLGSIFRLFNRTHRKTLTSILRGPPASEEAHATCAARAQGLPTISRNPPRQRSSIAACGLLPCQTTCGIHQHQRRPDSTCQGAPCHLDGSSKMKTVPRSHWPYFHCHNSFRRVPSASEGAHTPCGPRLLPSRRIT